MVPELLLLTLFVDRLYPQQFNKFQSWLQFCS